MPNEDNKILKYNHGEKSLKAPFFSDFGTECLLKKCIHVKITQRNLIQREKLSIYLNVAHGL